MHKDVHERLYKINPALYKEAQAVLEQNKAERHIRGGMATKEKYLNYTNIETRNTADIIINTICSQNIKLTAL